MRVRSEYARATPKAPTPWVRHTDHLADVDVRILSDRTPDGGTATRLVDGRGALLHEVVGLPGREEDVALEIAHKVTDLLRGA
jgi:hypothetical protein